MRLLTALGALFLLSLAPVSAQMGVDLPNFFGALIQSGVVAAAQQKWENVPRAEVACLDQALRARGSSINSIVRRGISPDARELEDLRHSCSSANRMAKGPSFDCRKARFADERAICADPELSRLDLLIAQGFDYLRDRYDNRTATAVGFSHLRARQACGGDVLCIRKKQIAAIRDYRARGASIDDPDSVPTATQPKSVFTVDGLALGAHVASESQSYREYQCRPSEQFDGMTWCSRRRSETSGRGPYTSVNTILHTQDGTALYINRYLQPAFFAGDEASDDIKRLSIRFGSPHTLEIPNNSEFPYGLIAYWGQVKLDPISPDLISQIAAGRDVKAGLLVDHLNDFRRSAQLGLPIYRLAGGAGYVWIANWGNAGIGRLRFLAADPAAIEAGRNGAGSAGEAAFANRRNTDFASEKEASLQVDRTTGGKEQIKHMLKVIAEKRDQVRDPDGKKRLEEIEAHLTVENSDQTDVEKQHGLLAEVAEASQIIEEAEEFRGVADVAGRRITTVENELRSVSFDDPFIQQIKATALSTKQAISDGRLKTLKDALAQLNSTFDQTKLSVLKEAKASGFDTVENYQKFKQDQARLGQSGIIIKPK